MNDLDVEHQVQNKRSKRDILSRDTMYDFFHTKKGRFTILLGIFLAICLYLTLSGLIGIGLFSQVCPLGTWPKENSIDCPGLKEDNQLYNYSNYGHCKLFYKNYGEKFTVCGNDRNDILEEYPCDLEYVEQNYCEKSVNGGLVAFGTFVGIFLFAFEILIFLIFPASWIMGSVGFIAGLRCVGIEKKIVNGVMLGITVLIGFIVVIVLFQFWFGMWNNGIDLPKDYNCSIFQKCAGDDEYCVGSDKYCYIEHFAALQFWFVFQLMFSSLTTLLIFMFAYLIIWGIAFGIKWAIVG